MPLGMPRGFRKNIERNPPQIDISFHEPVIIVGNVGVVDG
jgi:hypothetical protein